MSHLGEYPEEYEEGEIVKHPAWIAGFQGALPGIHMPAAPAIDTPSYAQGWGPKVGWDDRGAASQRRRKDPGHRQPRAARRDDRRPDGPDDAGPGRPSVVKAPLMAIAQLLKLASEELSQTKLPVEVVMGYSRSIVADQFAFPLVTLDGQIVIRSR